MKISIGGKIGVGYGVILVALVVVGTVSFQNLRRLNSDAGWVVHTVQVMKSVQSLDSRMTEAESSERGYLLTRNPAFLERFRGLPSLIHQNVEELRDLTADNPAQQQRLDRIEPLVQDRVALLAKASELFQARGKMDAELEALFARGQQEMGEVQPLLQQMEDEERQLLDRRRSAAGSAEKTTSLTILGGTLLALLLGIGIGGIIVRGISSSLRSLNEAAVRFGAGDYGQRAQVLSQDDLGVLAGGFNAMAAQVEERQRTLAEQEWLKGNLARFRALLQGQRDPAAVGRTVASEIAALLGVRHAALYLAEEESGTGLPLLRWRAGYAVADDRQVVRPGEGLVGQCFVEKKPVFLDRLPPDYLRIKSALGEAAPRSAAILPILFEERVRGVLEVASFQELAPIQQAFLLDLLAGLGLMLNAIEANLRTEELLRQAEVMSTDLHEKNGRLQESEQLLQGQQEELRQTNEELQQTNEELGQANTELEERAERLDEQRREMERKNEEIAQAQRALEEKAAQLALTSKYKSEFLANMSHELRTPLNSLLILAKILGENGEGNLSPKQIQYAETIRGAGNDLLQLINDILDLAKIESGTVEAEVSDLDFGELAQFVENSFRPLAETKRLEFRIDLDPRLPASLRTDVRRVRQVVKNLLSNAFKFTEHGAVVLRVEAEPGGGAALSVRDTGVGIPAEKLEVIFEAFQQAEAGTARRYGGTGLGLSISRELAHLLDGTLHVASVPGEGSTFTLRLPPALGPARARTAPALREMPRPEAADRLPEPEEEVADDRKEIAPGDLVLLVVEDDAAFARLVAEFAREKGFKVVMTARGGDAPLLAARFQPAAITLDLHLPDQEGWVVLDRLKHSPATRHIPVHILSVQEERERGLRLGAVSCLKKPVTREEIDGVLGQMREFAARAVKNLLLVEDDLAQRQGMVDLIGNGDVVTTAVATGAAALAALEEKHFDCLILDLGLPDIGGLDLIRRIKEKPGGATLPIIIYTGRNLSEAEEMELQQLSEAIIIKDVKSPERLLDETALFLHRVQSKLPEAKRRLIEQARKEDSVLANRTVLVVDDDPRNIFAITAALEQYRMRVLYANNGREGLELLGKNPEIQAVLMDVMMPEMDGFEAMRRIRADARHRRLPVLAITAKAMKGDREKCIEAGASDYITKPVDMDHLRSLLRVWLYK